MHNINSTTKDVIIVLGGGIDPDGSLPSITRSRVQKGVDLFREGAAPRLLMSGCWDFWREDTPLQTEAEAMKEYATALGVSPGVIFKEEESKDTIGNAYFCKIQYLRIHHWNKVIVITSDYHMNRTKLIFEKVLGSEYTVEFISVETHVSKEILGQLLSKETKVVGILTRWLQGIESGDDDGVGKLLYTKHPGYAENPEITKKQLLKFLEG